MQQTPPDGATACATTAQQHSLKALAHKALLRNDRRNKPATDPTETVQQTAQQTDPKCCTPDPREEAYGWCLRQLAEHPGEKYAIKSFDDPDDDHQLLAVGVRGVGCVTLRIDRARFDGFKVIEILNRQREDGTHGSI